MSLRPLAIGVIIGHHDTLANIAKVKSLGLDNCQMAVPDPELRTGPGLQSIKDALSEAGITVTCVFSGYPGESYADIPTIRDTIGLVPPALRAERLRMTKEHSDFAKALGAPVLAAHIGFVPDDHTDLEYRGVVNAVQQVCNHCAANGQKFALETGQETAPVLLRFIQDVDRSNLGVNFDPANLMMYGSGDPIEAMDVVGKWIIGAHCKDGDYPKESGTLGAEYALGQGKVGIPRYIAKLKELGYTGPLTIEREISGDQQMADIRAAITLLEQIRGN